MGLGIIVQVGVLIFIILAMIRTDGTWPPFANDSYWTCPLQVNSWWPILLFLAMTMMASAAVVADEPKGLRFSRDRQSVLPFWMRWLVAFIQISAAISSMVIVLSLPISAASFLAFETAMVISVLTGIAFDRAVTKGLAARARQEKGSASREKRRK